MAQEFKNVAIIGGGASGCICAYYLQKAGIDVTIFDYSTPLRTLLPTGGGRCNLSNAEFDIKDLVKNYPRGEKFLYSIFSQFSVYDTLALFEELGIETYIQDNNRIFPTSNNAKEVKEAIWKNLKNVQFIKEKVKTVNSTEIGIKINTEKSKYLFTDAVISIGGKGLISGLSNKIIKKKPSLVGLTSDCNTLSGVILKNVLSKDIKVSDDILFTHFGVSGPLIYTISSIKAFDNFPYILSFDLYPQEFDLQNLLNTNPHKEIKNILSEILPKNFVKYLLNKTNILEETKAHKIDGSKRNLILENIHNFTINISGTNIGEETVTAGGFDLDEINAKTLESKLDKNIYFTRECLNIDGFCGGFNLQNAWSTAFVASQAIINK